MKQDIVAALLINGDYNVIVTHWGSGSGCSNKDYSQAIANIRVVGLEIAYLVNTLVVGTLNNLIRLILPCIYNGWYIELTIFNMHDN